MSKEVMKLALEALEGCAEYCVGDPAYRRTAITLREALAEQPAQQEPEFFTHNVEQPYDWSEWVCPDPKSYLMKCCDCGLVHEAEFGVVRYKSETEREDCEPVDDPNLQAVFRMRRSEQWSPADTAHRAGGLPMEQPAQQEPVGRLKSDPDEGHVFVPRIDGDWSMLGKDLYTSPPAQRKPLSVEKMFEAIRPLYNSDKAAWLAVSHSKDEYRAIEAAHGIKENT